MNIIKQSEILSSVSRYLSHFQSYYPGIMDWFPIVKDELREGKRRLLLAMNDTEILGLAITKNGPRAKLCHISVCQAVRKYKLGWTLMDYAIQDMVHNGAKEIHVTTGEEVFQGYKRFFSAAGFRPVDWQVNRYRRGVSEILWNKKVEPVHFQLAACSVTPSRPLLR